MKVYTILHNSKITAEEEALIVYCDDFSFSAFMLNFIWTAYRNLWLMTLGLLVLTFIVAYAEINEVIPRTVSMVIQMLISIFVGLEGNNWYMMKLLKSGYKVKSIISADSKDEALLKYLQSK
jgi:hypothetical protein